MADFILGILDYPSHSEKYPFSPTFGGKLWVRGETLNWTKDRAESGSAAALELSAFMAQPREKEN